MSRAQDPGSMPAREPRGAVPAGAEDRFQTLFEQAPFSVQLLALDGTTLRVNAAWEALWQGNREHVLHGYNVFRDPQLEASGVAAQLRRAFAGESVVIDPVEYDPGRLGKPGRARWVRAHAHPIRDPQGRVREVMLIHEDVTATVLAQRELQHSVRQLRDTEAGLRAAEERARLATEAGNIGIWEWDVDGDRVTWSDRVYALHGLEPGTFAGTSAAFTALVHPDDLGPLWARVQEAIREGTAFSGEFRTVLPDGSVRWLSTWARVHRTAQGSARLVGATISVHDYKTAEAALRENDRRKDEFLAMLAHELRNPLAPILTAAELLRLQAGGEGSRETSEVIARQARHLSRLLDDLLDASRVTRGRVKLELAVVDLAAVVAAAIEQARPRISERDHVLTTRNDAGRLWVRGDRTRLTQMVVNLLDNAAKFTPRGGNISVVLSGGAGEASLTVRDTGEGIDAALLPHIFDLFTQGARPADRSQGGLGIGLALVRSLARLHGGDVRAYSLGAGAGARFVVTLPLASPGAAVPPPRPDAAAVPARRVLVVDDNRDAAAMLASLLALQGHRVRTAPDAATALALAGQEWPEVFILDIGLPGMDGHALCQALRATAAGRPAQYVALTGYGQEQDIARSRESGFDHHLVKPADPARLAELLAHA